MSFNIPLFKLNFDEREKTAIIDTIESTWISMGPKTEEFEEKFAQALGANHALGLSNCTVSLHLAFDALGIQEGDEVICPSLTFVATVNSIKYVGATPVFADIESTLRPVICPEDIKKKITSKTKAIVVMHMAGFPCDMNAIMELARKHNLKVVEDSCHAPLSEYQGKKLGTIGDIGCFSFFSNKNMSTGEGGMLITNKKEIYEQVKLMRSHGMTTMSYERSKGHSSGYDVIRPGYNFRIDDMRSSLGIIQLEKLPADLKRRETVRSKYEKELSTIQDIQIPFRAPTEFSSNYVFPILVKEASQRDSLRKYLSDHGIQTSLHYPPVHLFSQYYDEKNHLPNTEAYANSTVTLPMFADLKEDEIQYIAQQIKSFFK